jgi:hypothetical protein
MATINPSKLTFTFAEAASFRYDGKSIDLSKATDQITVKDKHGNDKKITGFQAADGTFFRLKKTADGKHQIDVYGTPEQLAGSNLQVRGGDVTRARFGEERLRKTGTDPFKPRNFHVDGSQFKDMDTFAAAHGLAIRQDRTLDAGQPKKDASQGPAQGQPPDQEDDLLADLLANRIEVDRNESRRMSERLDRRDADRLIEEGDSRASRLSVGARPQRSPDLTGSAQAGSAPAEIPTATQSVANAHLEVHGAINDSMESTNSLKQTEIVEAGPDAAVSKLTDDTPIDSSQHGAVFNHAGYGDFFVNPDADFLDRLSGYLALMTGQPRPAPGTPPLSLLDKGQLTFGQLTKAIDRLSVHLGSEGPRQDPKQLLGELGLKTRPTLSDGNCLYAALAHHLEGSDSLSRSGAQNLRRELHTQFLGMQRGSSDAHKVITGRGEQVDIDRVNQTLLAGLDGKPVDADGWGGEESLKLAAMGSGRTVVTVSDEDMRIFDPQGGMKSFSIDQRAAFKEAVAGLANPVVLSLQGYHWEATESTRG